MATLLSMVVIDRMARVGPAWKCGPLHRVHPMRSDITAALRQTSEGPGPHRRDWVAPAIRQGAPVATVRGRDSQRRMMRCRRAVSGNDQMSAIAMILISTGSTA